MITKGRGFLVMAVVSMICCSSVLAQDAPELGFEAGADYFSKYVWRGQSLQDDGAFQPWVGVSYGNLSGSIWASMDLSNVNGNGGDITEVDYSLDYSDTLFEGIGYSLGIINYQFPNTDFDDTTEAYWGFSFDLPLSPSVTVYHDVDEANGGIYVSLGVGHSFDLVGLGESVIPLELSASYGWANSDYNEAYWGVDEGASNDLLLSAALPIPLNDSWTLTPSINYSMLIDDDVRSAASSADNFFVGVSLSVSF